MDSRNRQTWESTRGSRLESTWTSEVESSQIHLPRPPDSSSAIGFRSSRLEKNWSLNFNNAFESDDIFDEIFQFSMIFRW